MAPIDVIIERQTEYFEIVRRAFRWLSADQSNLAPDKVHGFVLDALAPSKLVMFRGANIVPTAYGHIEAFLDEIRQFWHQNEDQMAACTRDLEGNALVAYFEPLHIATDIAPLLVFHDHVIIPDPFLLALTPTGVGDLSLRAPSLLADLYLLLCWRHLFCPQHGQVPLILIPGVDLPGTESVENRAEYVLRKRRQLLSELFSGEVKDEEDVRRIASDCPVSVIVGKGELGDAVSLGLSYEGIMTKINMERNLLGTRLSSEEARNDTLFLLNDVATRLDLLSRNIANATRLLQDFHLEPWNWSLCKWLLSSESQRTASLLELSFPEEHFFQLAVRTEPLKWLAQLPLAEVLELRRHCSVDSLRQEMNHIRQRIRRARTADVRSMLKAAGECMKAAFEQHRAALANLRRQRFIRTTAAAGTLGLAAAATIAGTVWPPLLIPGAALSLVAGGNLIDLVKSYSNCNRDIAQEQGRPLGLLCQLHDKRGLEDYYDVAARNVMSYALATRLGAPFHLTSRSRKE